MNTHIILRQAAIYGARTLPLILALLGGCAADVSSSSNLASSDTSRFEENWDILPTELHGGVPGRAGAELTSLYPHTVSPAYTSFATTHMLTMPERVVLYVNGAHLPMDAQLCSQSDTFRTGTQVGPKASVTAALCVGNAVVSVAKGTVLAQDQPSSTLKHGFGTIKDQLFDVLTPGPEAGENS